jgi:hypothetical protein
MNLFAVPAGRTAKWVVFVVTLLVFAGFASQGGRFEQAQKNETSSFLPGGVESVKALKQIERFPGGEEAPAVIVYERQSRLTGAHERGRGPFRSVATQGGGDTPDRRSDALHAPGFHRSRVRTRTSAAASPASAIPAEISSSSLRPDANAAS